MALRRNIIRFGGRYGARHTELGGEVCPPLVSIEMAILHVSLSNRFIIPLVFIKSSYFETPTCVHNLFLHF